VASGMTERCDGVRIPRNALIVTFSDGLCTPLTALEAMINSPDRRIWGGARGDISAGQRGVRIDLEGDGDQRQDKNDDESSHGPVCRGRMRRKFCEWPFAESRRPAVLNLKFVGLQIDSMIADSPDFGEDWLWVDALPRWG
jgi:hypothetical protein